MRTVCDDAQESELSGMTDFITQPKNQALIKLTGTIKNLKATREHASFVFTESDQTKMGVIAVAAAAAGMGGQAMSTAASASDMEEAADYVEFELNGQPVKGWVWRNPFHEGDIVDVAAEWQNDHYETFGIARPRDKTIALYPHCSRGKARHNKNAIKWWLIGGGGFLFLLTLLMLIGGGLIDLLKAAHEEGWATYIFLGPMAFFALMTYSLSRKCCHLYASRKKFSILLNSPTPAILISLKAAKRSAQSKTPVNLVRSISAINVGSADGVR